MEICLKTWKIMIDNMLMKTCKSNDLSDKDTISGKKTCHTVFLLLSVIFATSSLLPPIDDINWIFGQLVHCHIEWWGQHKLMAKKISFCDVVSFCHLVSYQGSFVAFALNIS